MAYFEGDDGKEQLQQVLAPLQVVVETSVTAAVETIIVYVMVYAPSAPPDTSGPGRTFRDDVDDTAAGLPTWAKALIGVVAAVVFGGCALHMCYTMRKRRVLQKLGSTVGPAPVPVEVASAGPTVEASTPKPRPMNPTRVATAPAGNVVAVAARVAPVLNPKDS